MLPTLWDLNPQPSDSEPNPGVWTPPHHNCRWFYACHYALVFPQEPNGFCNRWQPKHTPPPLAYEKPAGSVCVCGGDGGCEPQKGQDREHLAFRLHLLQSSVWKEGPRRCSRDNHSLSMLQASLSLSLSLALARSLSRSLALSLSRSL